MTHQEIQANEIIEQYVRGKLRPDERRAFQEHIFECDECFQQAEVLARFVAGVRDASRTGLLVAHDRPEPARTVGAWSSQGWALRWAAASLLIAIALIGWWALSLRRQNQQLAQQTAEQNRAAEQLKLSEAKIRELENRSSALQAEKESLQQQNQRLHEQLQPGSELAQVRQPETNLPTINIYPIGDAQRSGGTSEVNQLRLPPGTRTFVLLLSDFEPGLSSYRVEIMNSSGQTVARRAGLKPDRNSEIRVTLNRSLLTQEKYTLKLLGQGKLIAEYAVQFP